MSINVFLIILTSVSLLWYLFIYWYEGKKDGFDQYKLLDLCISLVIVSSGAVWVLLKLLDRVRVYYYDSFLLDIDSFLLAGFTVYMIWLLGSFYYSKRNVWSVFRLLDLFALAQFTLIFWLAIGGYLLYKNTIVVVLLVSYFFIYWLLKSFNIRSGYYFSFISVIHALVLLFITGLQGRLPIAVFMLTIAVFVVYLRRKNIMTKSSLSADFIDLIKKQLKIKDADLKEQEEILKAEDPYLQEGRTEGNSEDMDEAILEDSRKEVSDAKLGIIQGIRNQIARALSFIKIGKYGICEICGQPIDKARLKAYPEATKCVRCAARSDL